MSAGAFAELFGAVGLTHAQWRVAVAVSDTVNAPHEWKFWAAPETLAAWVDMPPASVRKRLHELADMGWIEVVEEGGGRGRRAMYQWLGNPRPESIVTKPGKPRRKGTVSGKGDVVETAPSRHVNRAVTTRKPRPESTVSPSTPLIEQKRELKGTRTRAFDEFWATYPKKVGKLDARRAYDRAMKLTDPATILAAVARSVPDWVTQDARYIPHPATWLNRGSWDDESQIELEHARSSAAARQARRVMGLPDDPYALAVGDGK